MENSCQCILEMRGITKQFPGVKALGNVSFQVLPGETHALMGANGAGKSTLMKILGGVYQPDSGTITFCGNEVHIKNPSHAQDLGISIVFQELNVIPHLSVLENIFLNREIIKSGILYDWKEMKKQTLQILSDLNIDNIDINAKVQDLSIAKQQMVEIVRAVSRNSKVIIFDEPTSSLSIKETEILYKIIEKLKAMGKSIVYISHRLEEIFKVSDRLTLLRDGKFVFCDNMCNITHEHLVDSIVGHKVEKKQYHRECISGELLKVSGLTSSGLFKDISFTLHKGEVLGFAGLVGAGRTEVAKAIIGEYKYQEGQMEIKGEAYSSKSPCYAIKRGIAYATENRKEEGLLLVRSIRENMSLSSIDKLRRGFVINQRNEKGIVKDNIKEFAIKVASQEHAVENLSGGNQQKVCLAKWVLTKPEILILDEPTMGIDVGARAEFYSIINELALKGVGVILISSEEDELVSLCDRIEVFRNGSIVGEVFPQEGDCDKELMQLILGLNVCNKSEVAQNER